MPVLIEIHNRESNRLVLKLPLYEFLMTMYVPQEDEVCFEDLRIVVDGAELSPSQCAKA